MGKTRGIGAPDDVLTIASQLECRREEKNLENIWEMSVESMKIARNRFYYYSFFFDRRILELETFFRLKKHCSRYFDSFLFTYIAGNRVVISISYLQGRLDRSLTTVICEWMGVNGVGYTDLI